jgi:hypothetical protein
VRKRDGNVEIEMTTWKEKRQHGKRDKNMEREMPTWK